jgi:1-deoxy-D-xylulose-5-phosphate synthase
MSILSRIQSPNDLKKLSVEELAVLSREIREKIIQTCSRTGGHVAPSLGVVELTLALYRVFDADRDKIIWDVGHQTYAQKLVTGRYEKFDTLRAYKGISGFPKRHESKYDVFDTGHSSTSLSAATGFALARDLKGDNYQIISVIGDGSLGAGMAFEALNHLGHLNRDVIVVLNDNERSIGESVGALSQYLTGILTTRSYNRLRDDLWVFFGRFPPYFRDRMRNLAKRVQEGLKGLYTPPAVIFEELGFRYIGPLNGHKLNELVDTFSRVREMKGPRFVHVVTKKGLGFAPAEKNPERFHGIGPFDCQTGEEKSKTRSYTDVFGDALVGLARNNRKIVAITAGMCLGTGLARFRDEIPERFFDVGITEQHAVTMAAALALEGYIPVCAIYSTFLQRAYDQLIHDVALQRLPVIFCVDRAGLVGEDGPTHHGPFDLSYAASVPNLIVSAPRDGNELAALLKTAVGFRKGPFFIRYPRGACGTFDSGTDPAVLRIGEWETVRGGKNPVVIAIGSMVRETLAAAELLSARHLEPLVINGRFLKPLDEKRLDQIADSSFPVFTVEENSVAGGFGSAVSDYIVRRGSSVKVHRIGLPDQFIEHGPRSKLLKITGLDAEGITRQIIDKL